MVPTEPGSQEQTEHGGLDNSHHPRSLGTINAKRPDPQIVQQPFPLKTPIFAPSFEVHKSMNLDVPGRKTGSFLTLPTLVFLLLHLH